MGDAIFGSSGRRFIAACVTFALAMASVVVDGGERTRVETRTGEASPETARFRPHASLDTETGRLIYSITNVSDRPVAVSMQSLSGLEGRGLPISPGGLGYLYEIEIDGTAQDVRSKLPGAESDLFDTNVSLKHAIAKLCHEFGERLRDDARNEDNGQQDRMVTIRPSEGLSISIVLQDQPWFDDVVALLEATGYDRYRINPQAAVFCADDSGKVSRDEASELAYRPTMKYSVDGSFQYVYPASGPTLDLATAKALQARRMKKARDPQRSPSVIAPPRTDSPP